MSELAIPLPDPNKLICLDMGKNLALAGIPAAPRPPDLQAVDHSCLTDAYVLA